MQLIGHNPETEATCFFETAFGIGQKNEALTVDERLVRSTLPALGDLDYSYTDVYPSGFTSPGSAGSRKPPRQYRSGRSSGWQASPRSTSTRTLQTKTRRECYAPVVDVHPGILTIWLILPAGCTGDSPVTNTPTDTTASAESAPVPEWTAEQAAARMESLADHDFPDPTQLRELYLSMLQAGDSRCPGENLDELADGSIPLGGCTSSTGYHYVGLSEFTESNDDGWSFALALGDLYITDPDGDTFSAGGTFSYDAKVTAAGSQWEGDATGTFSYPGGTHWIAEGGSLAYWVEGGTAADHAWLLLSGSIGGPLGTDNLYFDQLLYDSDCGESPVGGLRVRGGDGRWYHLEFDANCSGCGELTFSDTVEMGQVCVDLKSLGAELIERMAL